MTALLMAVLLAHPPLEVAEKVFGADLVVEVRLPEARVVRVLYPPESEAPVLPPKPFVFAPGSACARALAKSPDAKALLFYRRGADGKLEQLGSLEQQKGPWTSLHPDYERWVRAVATAKRWTEERMRAVSDELLFIDQRVAVAQKNDPYLAWLAARFLEAHDFARVVDEAWGAPGTEQRKQKERWASAGLQQDGCPVARRTE